MNLDSAELIERGKQVVASGVHAPPPPVWTAAERAYWFGDGIVVNLAEYRWRREANA